MDSRETKHDRLGRIGRIAKDWITTALAVCAFVFSLPNAYKAISRIDDLQAIALSFPEIDIDFANSTGSFNDDKASFVFINSGNRSAVVTGIRLVAAQQETFGSTENCSGPAVEGEAEPFVVKENETLTKPVKLRPLTRYIMPENNVRVGDARKLEFSIHRDPHKDYFISVCMIFDVTFSGYGWVTKNVNMTMTGYSPDGSGYDTGGDFAPRTILIRRRIGTIFSSDDDGFTE
jgi:hypothetical protein